MIERMRNTRDGRIAFYLKELAEAPLPSAVLHERLSRSLIERRIKPVEHRVVQTDLASLQDQLGDHVLARVTRKQLPVPVPAALSKHRYFFYLVDAAAIYHLPEPIQYLSELELVALEAARDAMGAGASADANPLSTALRGLIERLSIPANQMPQSVGTACAPRQPFAAKHILAILRARRLGMGLSIAYAPLDKATKRYRVFPVLLWFSDGEPYCWVWDIEAEWLKNFKLCRASAIEVIDLPGFIPSGIEAEAKRLCSESFRGIANDNQRARVVIRFRGGAIPFIRDRIYGCNQKVADLPSGEVRLTFDTAGLGGVYHWILQFGADAIVEKPAALAKWVQAEALRITQQANP